MYNGRARGKLRGRRCRDPVFYALTSERRRISSWVMSRCNVFSALPGSVTKRKPS